MTESRQGRLRLSQDEILGVRTPVKNPKPTTKPTRLLCRTVLPARVWLAGKFLAFACEIAGSGA